MTSVQTTLYGYIYMYADIFKSIIYYESNIFAFAECWMHIVHCTKPESQTELELQRAPKLFVTPQPFWLERMLRLYSWEGMLATLLQPLMTVNVAALLLGEHGRLHGQLHSGHHPPHLSRPQVIQRCRMSQISRRYPCKKALFMGVKADFGVFSV